MEIQLPDFLFPFLYTSSDISFCKKLTMKIDYDHWISFKFPML